MHTTIIILWTEISSRSTNLSVLVLISILSSPFKCESGNTKMPALSNDAKPHTWLHHYWSSRHRFRGFAPALLSLPITILSCLAFHTLRLYRRGLLQGAASYLLHERHLFKHQWQSKPCRRFNSAASWRCNHQNFWWRLRHLCERPSPYSCQV